VKAQRYLQKKQQLQRGEIPKGSGLICDQSVNEPQSYANIYLDRIELLISSNGGAQENTPDSCTYHACYNNPVIVKCIF